MIDLESVRELIYKEKNELLLSIYRDMSEVNRLGLSVDETLYEHIGQHLSKDIDLWLAEFWCSSLPNYEECKYIMSMDHALLKMLQLILENTNNRSCIDHLLLSDDEPSSIFFHLDVPERWSEKGIITGLIINLSPYKNSMGFTANIAWDGYRDILYLGACDLSGQGGFDYWEGRVERAFGSGENFLDYLNYVVGITGYFRKKGT